MKCQDYFSNPGLLEEFRQLVSNHCTFVSSWDDPIITNNVFRLFGKWAPARDAEQRFLSSLEHSAIGPLIKKRHAQDFELPMQSHGQWFNASHQTTQILNRKTKESQVLTFYPFAVFEFTFNKPGMFSQSQLGMTCSVPPQHILDEFKPFPILVAPLGVKHVNSSSTSKEELLQLGWKATQIGIAPQHSHQIGLGL